MNAAALVAVPQWEIQPQGRSLRSMYEDFVTFAQVSEVTQKSYDVCIRCFLDWMQDNGIQYPQWEDMQNYVKYLATPHPRRSRRGTSPKLDAPERIIQFSAGTQARYMQALRVFFKWLAQRGWYTNITIGIKGAKVRADNKKRDPLLRADAITLLNSIDRSTDAGKRDYAMILLSITCGLRIIEMQRASIGNLETIAGEPVIFIQGKGHAEADDYKKLTPEVQGAINEYLATRTRLNADAPLFASVGNRSKGQRLTEPSISRIIKTRLIDAGFNTHRISAHSLRHSSVTFLLEAGATMQEAQEHARHSKMETTLIYSHNLDKKKQHTEQRVYNFLFGVEATTTQQAVDCMKRMTEAQQQRALELLQAIAG